MPYLAERFSACPEIARFDDGAHKEAWALAISFADLEESFRVVLDDFLPKICDAAPSEVNDALFDLGEEFRHVLWHILEAQKYYRYLVEQNARFLPRK